MVLKTFKTHFFKTVESTLFPLKAGNYVCASHSSLEYLVL